MQNQAQRLFACVVSSRLMLENLDVRMNRSWNQLGWIEDRKLVPSSAEGLACG